MPLFLQGALLFLFIPLVLVLYLRVPLGLPASVLGGFAITIAHRFVARPWMERHLAERCFWCGRAGAPVDATFFSKGKAIAERACSEEHGDDLHAFAHVVATGKPLLALLIFVLVSLWGSSVPERDGPAVPARDAPGQPAPPCTPRQRIRTKADATPGAGVQVTRRPSWRSWARRQQVLNTGFRSRVFCVWRW